MQATTLQTNRLADMPERIPLVNVLAQNQSLKEELRVAVEGVVESCQFVGGAIIDVFGCAFADYCRVGYCIPCSNGTDALRLAILALVGQGNGQQEIVTVSHTFAATAEAIVQCGYRPVLVDVDPCTYLMNLDLVVQACGEQTAAIVPVHLYGQMVDIRRLNTIAERFEIPIIEDAAQAHGALRDGIGPGQRSAAATFSLFPGKNLGAWGDAGAVICNSSVTAEKVRQLADHGRVSKYEHEIIGWNARMDSIQAAVLGVKLPNLNRWLDRRREVAQSYRDRLDGVEGIKLPTTAPGATHTYHQFVVQVANRDRVAATLSDQNIMTGIHYPIPVHRQPAFDYLGYAPDDLPVTNGLCDQILSLPIYPEMRRDQLDRVCDALKRCVPGAGAQKIAAAGALA